MEKESSVMVNRGCHLDSTGTPCRASTTVNQNEVFICVFKICTKFIWLEHTTELSLFILMKYIVAMLLSFAVLHQFPSLTLDNFFIKMFMIVPWKHTLMSKTTTMIGLHLAINILMMWESHKMLQRILIKILPHLNSNRPWSTSTFTTNFLIKTTRSLVAIMSSTALWEAAHTFYIITYGWLQFQTSLVWLFPHYQQML